jgi:lipoprotein-anchoring transpeptidase ErfK/SrfK
MLRPAVPLLIGLLACSHAWAQSASYGNPGQAMTPPMVVTAPPPPPMRSDLGGGFIEFLFGGSGRHQQPQAYYTPPAPQPRYVNVPMAPPPMVEAPRQSRQFDPRFRRREVDYHGKEAPGTIIVDTPHHFLYLVESGGRALRYGIGVGREGFTWSGTHHISAKKEWPDWTPPKEMLERQPYLPHFMAGGPDNPLGARAMYIGKTLYRIHGSNEPWTIGHNVSSGCIRLRNVDVIDLYSRVKIGAKVVVLPAHPTGVASAIPRSASSAANASEFR